MFLVAATVLRSSADRGHPDFPRVRLASLHTADVHFCLRHWSRMYQPSQGQLSGNLGRRETFTQPVCLRFTIDDKHLISSHLICSDKKNYIINYIINRFNYIIKPMWVKKYVEKRLLKMFLTIFNILLTSIMYGNIDLRQLSWRARTIPVEVDNTVGLRTPEQTLQHPCQHMSVRQYDTISINQSKRTRLKWPK